MCPMKLTQVRALRGPNLWSNDTAIQADVNVGARQALVLSELARELQVEVGCNVKLAKATAPNRSSDARVVVGYTEAVEGLTSKLTHCHYRVGR